MCSQKNKNLLPSPFLFCSCSCLLVFPLCCFLVPPHIFTWPFILRFHRQLCYSITESIVIFNWLQSIGIVEHPWISVDISFYTINPYFLNFLNCTLPFDIICNESKQNILSCMIHDSLLCGIHFHIQISGRFSILIANFPINFCNMICYMVGKLLLHGWIIPVIIILFR